MAKEHRIPLKKIMCMTKDCCVPLQAILLRSPHNDGENQRLAGGILAKDGRWGGDEG